MTAFAVRIPIVTPIILHHLLHLDAVLGRVVTDNGQSIDDLPLTRTGQLWHASAALLETPAFGSVDYQIQRIKSLKNGQFPEGVLDHLPSSKRSIGPMSDFRAVLTPHSVTAGITAIWFAFDGDVDKIIDLLDDVLDFGSCRKVGFGKRDGYITSYPITSPYPAGLMFCNGLPARSIPLSMSESTLGIPCHPKRLVRKSTWMPDYRSGKIDVCVMPPQRELTGTKSEIMGLIGA